MARLQRNAYVMARNFIAERDGERCLICRKKGTLKNPIEIDHMDRDTDNNSPQNLHFLCKTHNNFVRKLKPSEHRNLILRHYARCEREREREREREKNSEGANGSLSTEINKGAFDYASGSIEMRVNGLIEPRFREWIIAYLRVNGTIRRREAMDGGAEAVGFSQTTAGRYLDKMLSEFGILEEGIDTYGHRILKLKPDIMSSRKPTKAPREPLSGKSTAIKPLKGGNGQKQTAKRQNNDTKGEKQNAN